MIALKNLLIVFSISFIGTIPLGYLNLIAFEIYKKYGFDSVLLYILGIVLVEFIYINISVYFIKHLLKNKKLIQGFKIFSILFLYLLGFIFLFQNTQFETKTVSLNVIIFNSIFFTGVFLNAMNFVQIPFWLGWNIYLINSNSIKINSYLKIFYFSGIVLGTSLGMICFVLFFNLLFVKFNSILNSIYSFILPTTLLVLGTLQLIKYYKNDKK